MYEYTLNLEEDFATCLRCAEVDGWAFKPNVPKAPVAYWSSCTGISYKRTGETIPPMLSLHGFQIFSLCHFVAPDIAVRWILSAHGTYWHQKLAR